MPESLSKNKFLNIAFYRFFDFPRYEELRETLLQKARHIGLKGKLIIASEGLNGFLAAEESLIREYQNFLRTLPELPDFEYKESWSEHIPFKRMLVKLKKEIVTMGIENVRPHEKTGKRLPPMLLKKWLDENKDIILLDTRNEYEASFGTFEKAHVVPGLKHFRTFPQVLEKIRPEIEKKTVVMFCTGGIRCEKATAYALDLGLEDIYQLDGGILKYFEDCGSAHYKGQCFVFDERQPLNPNLSEGSLPSNSVDDSL